MPRRGRGRKQDYDEVKAALKRYYRFGELSKAIRDPQSLGKLQQVRESIFEEIKNRMRNLCGRSLESNPICFYLHVIGKVVGVDLAR
jgi:secreted Zn-dependent insulinase-like peptidase